MLALLANGDSSVGVLHQDLQLLLLLDLSVVGLDRHEEGDADGQGSDESNEGTGLSEILSVLLLRYVLLGGESAEEGLALLLSGLLGLLEFVRLLLKDGHSNVVRSTHRLLGGYGNFAVFDANLHVLVNVTGLGLLGDVDNEVVAHVSASG